MAPAISPSMYSMYLSATTGNVRVTQRGGGGEGEVDTGNYYFPYQYIKAIFAVVC